MESICHSIQIEIKAKADRESIRLMDVVKEERTGYTEREHTEER